nr:hypothetical protein BaRGS_029186 [Batillaria attramentaria]
MAAECTGVDGVWLPCGGGDDDGATWSVYTSDGPYLLSVTASVAATWVAPDAPVTLQATAQLARFTNLTQDGEWPDLDSEDGCLGNLLFVWDVVGMKVESKPASCNFTTCAHAPFTFLLTGNFSIASPGGGGASHIGSETSDEDGKAVVAVFTNASFDLEAGVGVGSDLTYVITVRDKKRGKKVRSYTVADTEPDGVEAPTLVFREPGLYTVHVNVSNRYGWDQQYLTVVVVERCLGEVHFFLQDGEASALPTFQTVTFHLTLVTADRHNTFLHVDFDDGHVKFAPLKEKKNKTEVRDGGSDDGEDNHFGTVLRGMDTSGSAAPEEEVFLLATTLSGTSVRFQFDFGYGWWAHYGDMEHELTRTTAVISHAYADVGLHPVTVFAHNAVSSANLTTYIMVQLPLMQLELVEPRVRVASYNVWEAEVSDGSHLVCQWSLGGEPEGRYTTTLTYTSEFGSEGVYVLGIHCHNDISSMSAALSVSVNHPVANVRLDVPVAVHGHPTFIRATVYAGRHFHLSCDFGDGTVEKYLSTELKLVSAARQLPSWQEAAPAYNVTLKHVYVSVGVYDVVVTVSNAVASLTRHKQAVVEEAISGITMFTDAPEVVQVMHPVTVTAVVASGENLQFDWDFSVGYYSALSVVRSDGDPVTYLFDFGDGTTQEVEGQLNFYYFMMAQVSHSYDRGH